MIDTLAIAGSGGHGRVVLDAAVKSGKWKNIVFLDDDPLRTGKKIDNVEIISTIDDFISNKLPSEFEVIIAIGDNVARRKVQENISDKGFDVSTVIHPSAILGNDIKISKGCQILPGAIINSGTALGNGSIINTGAIIEHDCQIGDYCHIGPGSVVLGNGAVGDNTLIGAKTAIQPGVSVGKNVIIGTGAVVISNINDGQTVVGVPAKPIRKPE